MLCVAPVRTAIRTPALYLWTPQYTNQWQRSWIGLSRAYATVNTPPTFRLSIAEKERYKKLQANGEPFAVLKVGGEVLDQELSSLVSTVKALSAMNLTTVIVHGGGPQMNAELKKQNVTPEYIGGHRVTDQRTLAIARDIFTGLNARLVKALQAEGVKAEGFPVGIFGAIRSTPELGFVGEIRKTHCEDIRKSIQNGIVPVLTSLGSRLDETSEDLEELLRTKSKAELLEVDNVLNINADVACRELCLELNPVKVVFTSSKGGFTDDDTGEILSEVVLETEYIKLVNRDYTGRQGTLLKLIEIKLLLDNLPKHSSVCITSASNILQNLFIEKLSKAERESKKVLGTTFTASSQLATETTEEFIPTKFSLKVGLLGARGYVGKEFCKLLLIHSEFELACASSRQLAGQSVISAFSLEENYANHRGISKTLTFENIEPEEIIAKTEEMNIHVWVLALPNNLSKKFVEQFDKNMAKSDVISNCVLIDLSADHRFEDTDKNWVYGLPERLNTREKLINSKRISNPGCYATGTQVALLPLFKSNNPKIRLKPNTVPSVFGVSGFSGAGTTPGRTNDVDLLTNNILPYKVIGHIHEKECSKHLGGKVDFTPHVAGWFQGIHLTVNAYLQADENGKFPTRDEVIAHYENFFKGELLIHINKVKDATEYPTVKDVMLKHHVELYSFEVDKVTGRIVIVSLIDNLLKGAATQAIQNLNLSLGIRELDGIEA